MHKVNNSGINIFGVIPLCHYFGPEAPILLIILEWNFIWGWREEVLCTRSI